MNTPTRLTIRRVDGSKFVVRAKLARVAGMLIERPQGITVWDTWPWATRLDRRIDRLRDDYGVAITTIMESHGDGKHARYVLTERLSIEG